MSVDGFNPVTVGFVLAAYFAILWSWVVTDLCVVTLLFNSDWIVHMIEIICDSGSNKHRIGEMIQEIIHLVIIIMNTEKLHHG